MHRHGYKGKKLGRERDQRRALIRGLATSLVEYEVVETTLPKAKAVVPYIEKLITKAKRDDLHSHRQVFSGLDTLDAAHKLIEEMAPQMKSRTSGHVRIERTRTRRGDNAQMAEISFVDDLSSPEPAPKVEPKKTDEHKPEKDNADEKQVESESSAKKETAGAKA